MMARFILIVIVTILLAQNASCKDIHFKEDSLLSKDVLRENIWNTIKTSAQTAWKMVKNLAENTKDKINSWINNVISNAQKIEDTIKANLKEIKNQSQIMLQEMLGETKIVKKCIKENKDSIDAILKNVMVNVSTCIAENINKLTSLSECQFKTETNLNINNTAFMESLEADFNSCLKKHSDEECIEVTHKKLFEDINTIETGIFATRTESRNIADDILDTIVNCSKDGLVNASTSIAAETLNIVKCVINNREVSVYE